MTHNLKNITLVQIKTSGEIHDADLNLNDFKGGIFAAV